MPKCLFVSMLQVSLLLMLGSQPVRSQHKHDDVRFSIQSVNNGNWSDAKTWKPARIPGKNDRVLVARGTQVEYDVKSKDVIRLLQVVGTLDFARDCDTELNVGILTVPHTEECSEHGFSCEFEGAGTGPAAPDGEWPSLLVGTPEDPIPAEHTARIRLHYLDGMDKDDAPAIACCSGRMEIHGSPLSRTWVKLGADAIPGDDRVTLSEEVTGWSVGDEVIVTASERGRGFGPFRKGARGEKEPQTEARSIAKIDGRALTLDQPLTNKHSGTGEFRSEVANLSRNVIIESADPDGVRAHAVYHAFSRGGISYARFAHLGKEGVLGRYSIHYHLVGDTMRGSCVEGASIVDSHNRWITIHGTQYLVVRDCVGYQSAGHGFFMEDGTEVYNLLDRNLGVHAYAAARLPNQVLPFDQNDGAAFWWANGLNTLTRNVGVESDRYGFRYDMQHTRQFDRNLPILQPDGSEKIVDVRTIPIWRFEDNEAHGNFAGMVVAANGGRQPDAPIRDQRMLDRIQSIDWTGPDTGHPHVIRNFKIWRAHYAFRPHSPAMLMDGMRIHDAAYGVYRPAFENHVYRNLHLSGMGPEPFNRGMDDASAQRGSITVDGMIVENLRGGNDRHPFVHMTDNALAAGAQCHFRDVVLRNSEGSRPLFNLGGSVRVDPFLDRGVPYFVHDHYGPGRDAKIVSINAKHLIEDGNKYREERPITGDESRIAEVKDVLWPELLDPVDDVPPATIVTSIRRDSDKLIVRGVSHDNGEIVSISVNGKKARVLSAEAGVVDWEATLGAPVSGHLVAFAKDRAGNQEQTAHKLNLDSTLAQRTVNRAPFARQASTRFPVRHRTHLASCRSYGGREPRRTLETYVLSVRREPGAASAVG